MYFPSNLHNSAFPLRAQQEPCGGGGGHRQTGLMVGRGYGVRRVCEVSAEATHTRDAVSFKLVQVCDKSVGTIGDQLSPLSGSQNVPRDSAVLGWAVLL